jgi:hypothetical protein
MAEIAQDIDYTELEGDPTPKAEYLPRLERCTLAATAPGMSLKISSHTSSGSRLNDALVTLVIAVASCVVALCSVEIGAPVWATVLLGCLPSAGFMLCQRKKRPRAAE